MVIDSPVSYEYETSTLGNVFGFDMEPSRDVPISVRAERGRLCPALNSKYRFDEDHLRRLLLWLGGIRKKNVLLNGPTGSGKSSLIEEVAARMGLDLYRVACHGKLEFQELVGQWTVLKDGSTEFVLGPLPRAMHTGAIFLLDEINFLSPSMQGALNTILDGGPLLVIETNQLVWPHADFRIAATGNAVERADDASLYRGTQRMNLAFMQRFLQIKVNYRSETDEVITLHDAFPALPVEVIKKMATTADQVRSAFVAGEVEAPISTRILLDWASVLNKRLPVLMARPAMEMKFGLQFVLTDGLTSSDAKVIEGLMDRLVGNLVLTPVSGKTIAKPVMTSTDGEDKNAPKLSHRIRFLLNRDRQSKGVVAFWIGVDPIDAASVGMSFNGTVFPDQVVRVLHDKDMPWLDKTCSSKISASGDKGYEGIVDGYFLTSNVEAAMRNVVSGLAEAVSASKTGRKPVDFEVATPETLALLELICRTAGFPIKAWVR